MRSESGTSPGKAYELVRRPNFAATDRETREDGRVLAGLSNAVRALLPPCRVNSDSLLIDDRSGESSKPFCQSCRDGAMRRLARHCPATPQFID